MENETNLPPVQTPAPAQTPVAAQTPAPVAFDPRRRIRELLTIPERDRTDAEWDELNELEIQTAPGNRVSNQQAGNAGYSGGSAKPGFHGKNRKGKGGGPGRPPQSQHQQSHPKPNNNPNKPRPA